MSCNGVTYIPNPPRAWSRVQRQCPSFELSPENYYKILMANKGNILQYKKNSACLTKKQIYSKMAQGKWTNRNTTYATQNDRGYTNPNIKMLKRNNFINIAIDSTTGTIIRETTQPISCPNNNLTQNDINPIIISDGGTLICNVIENPCTLYTSQTKANQFCNLTTDSNVPGPIKTLCWNNKMQTWYPKQQLNMNTSGNKWPATNGPPDDPTFISATPYLST